MEEGKSEGGSKNRVLIDHDAWPQQSKMRIRTLGIIKSGGVLNALEHVEPALLSLVFWLVKMTRVFGRKEGRVERVPGYGLHRFLGSICPPKFRERELDALHADAVELYFEKLKAGDRWGAWRVKWAMRGWMLWTVFGGAVGAVVTLVFGKAKSSK